MNGDPSICNGCGLKEPEVTFHFRKIGSKRYRNHLCDKCRAEYNRKYPVNKESEKRAQAKYHAKQQDLKINGINTEIFVFRNSRKFDKRRGLDFNLTPIVIRKIIEQGCTYCGEKEIGKIGLDRIDNKRGHEMDNVVAACWRCNYLRRDMPYEAWLMIVPGVRAAKELGAFGSWDGFGRKKKNGALAEAGIAPDC